MINAPEVRGAPSRAEGSLVGLCAKTRYALFRGRVSGKNPFPVVFRYKKRVTTDPKEILLFSVVQT